MLTFSHAESRTLSMLFAPASTSTSFVPYHKQIHAQKPSLQYTPYTVLTQVIQFSSLYVLPRAFLAARLLSLVSRTLLVFILSASATNIPAFAFYGLQGLCVRAAWWSASTGGMARVGTGAIVVSITPTDRIAVTKQAAVRITTIDKVASALVAGFSAISVGLRHGN